MASTPRLRFLKKQGVELKRSVDDGKTKGAHEEDASGQSSNESDAEAPKPLVPNPLNFESSDEDASDSGEPLLKISRHDVLKDLPEAKVSFSALFLFTWNFRPKSWSNQKTA
jgi:hypothetical protein